MSKRHEKAREGILWVLYAADITESSPRGTADRTRPLVDDIEPEIARTWEMLANRVNGIDASYETIDQEIQQVSDRWRIERMAVVDRNLLRIGVFEILETDIPAIVTINACVELAKSYGEESTPGFVNGLLDQLCDDHGIEVA